MSRPQGCFFGEKVTKDISKKVGVSEGLLLHISHASRDHTSDSKPVSLVVNNGTQDFVICTLKEFGHTPLDLNFASDITLKVHGPGKAPIHISGYWEFMADPDFEEEDEEEEEEEVVAKEAPKKSPKTEVKKSPKAEAKKSPKTEVKKSPKSAPAEKAVLASKRLEDIGDDDSMTPSLLELLQGMEFEEEEEEEPVEIPQPIKRKAESAPTPAKKQQKVEKKVDKAPAKKQQQQPPKQQQQKGGKKNRK